MKQQVAELFTKMGFDIDASQLDRLDTHIKNMRASSTLLARNMRVLNSQLSTTRSNITGVTRGLDSVSSRKNIAGLSNNYNGFSGNVRKAETALARFGRIIGIVEPRIASLNTRVVTITGTWAAYIDRLRQANAELSRLRSNSQGIRGAPNGPRGYGGGSGGNGGSSGRGGRAGGFLSDAAAFINPFGPAGLMTGGAVSAAIGTKELVKAGREVIRMKQAMLVATGSATEQGKALKFVDEQATRLGVSYVEMGKAYAQAKIATEGKLTDEQLQKMVTGVSEFSTTMHMSADDQKGVFRAMTQMFSKGKISLEEVNQMAERGIPALKLMQEASKKFYKVDDAGFQKMIQKGEIITKDIFPIMAQMMGEMARKGGALEKAMSSSSAAQARMTNEWQKFADKVMESGLDKALGQLFNGMADVLRLAAPLGKGLAEAVVGIIAFGKAVKDFIKDNPMIVAALTALIVLFIAKGRAAKGAGSLTNQFFVLLLSNIGLLKKALMRFPLLALFYALYKIFEAFGQIMKGDENWLSFLGELLVLGTLKLETFIAKLRLLWEMLVQGLKDNFITRALDKIRDAFDDPFKNGTVTVNGPNNQLQGGPYSPIRPSTAPVSVANNMNKFHVTGEALVDMKFPDGSSKRVAVPLSAPAQRIDLGGLNR